jgi:RNA polymerase sigma-70 factor (ECF subfamily)
MEERDHHREKSLQRAILSGDETAWRILYEENFEPLYGFVLWRCGRDVSVAEEIVQETWLVAVRRIATFVPESSSFLTWLRGVAENLLRNQRRKAQLAAVQEVDRRDVGEVSSTQAEPAEQLGRSEEILRALCGLPNGYRNVLEAFYMERRTVKEISSAWECSAKSVESALTRARAAFRKEFSRLGERS